MVAHPLPSGRRAHGRYGAVEGRLHQPRSGGRCAWLQAISDYSIKYTDPDGVTNRMDQLMDVATLGVGAVHPAKGDCTQNGLRDMNDEWWTTH